MNITIHQSIVTGVLSAPASKSYSHRAIILASLARGTSILSKILQSDDIEATIHGCKTLGAKIEMQEDKLVITGFDGKPTPTSATIDCKASGTTLRLLSGVAALSPQMIELTGSKRLLARPIDELTTALNTIIKQEGGEVTLSGAISSQFTSALLFIAPLMKNPVTILPSDEARSKPYIDITIEMMEKFGVRVERKEYKRFTVSPAFYSSTQLQIEGDYSNASYFFAAAAITGGQVTVTNLNPSSKQGDRYFLEILKMMGCTVEIKEHTITVSGKPQRGVEIDMANYPDIVQTIAVVAAVVSGVTIIKNISHLREKETNRIDHTAEELLKFGIKTQIADDRMIIYGGVPHGAVINPHNDHRMAMSMAILALVADGESTIQNAEVVSKSYPEFWNDLHKIIR